MFLFLAMFQQSCPDGQSQRKETPETKAPAVGRFVPSPSGVDLAFDNQTGQICRTWDWENIGGQAKPSRSHTTPSGHRLLPEEHTTYAGDRYEVLPTVGQAKPTEKRGVAARVFPQREGEFAPTCLSLYKEEAPNKPPVKVNGK